VSAFRAVRVSPEQFARVAGSPGESPRLAGLLRVLWPFFLLVFAAGYLLRAAWPFPELNTTGIGAGFLALAGVLAWSVTFGRRRLESFLKGARGEESVARALSFLPAAYRVYHGLSASEHLLGAEDYDHIVVGPTGIFLIETKSWNGRITVDDGRILYDGTEPDRPPLEQAKQAAATLRRDLRKHVHPKLDVHPVLCFAQGRLPDGRMGAVGVMICTADNLVETLQEQPDAPLPSDIVERAAYYLDQRQHTQAG
jgi:uncharacterized protein (TIGR03382 family)